MQNAETVLDVIGKRGARGLPLQRLYRQMFNPQLFLVAYGRMYANKGAMTPGVTAETPDGMSTAALPAVHATKAQNTTSEAKATPIRLFTDPPSATARVRTAKIGYCSHILALQRSP